MTGGRSLVGKPVRLTRTTDEHTTLTPGIEGMVVVVDDMGTLHVRWDDGSHLGLVHETGDRWVVPR
jgi:hypothetical protein